MISLLIKGSQNCNFGNFFEFFYSQLSFFLNMKTAELFSLVVKHLCQGQEHNDHLYSAADADMEETETDSDPENTDILDHGPAAPADHVYFASEERKSPRFR